jgi:hypothetical protein
MHTGSVMRLVHPKVPSETEATIAPVVPAPISRPSPDRQHVRLALTRGGRTILRKRSTNTLLRRLVLGHAQNYGGALRFHRSPIQSPVCPYRKSDCVSDFYSAGCRFESCWDRQVSYRHHSPSLTITRHRLQKPLYRRGLLYRNRSRSLAIHRMSAGGNLTRRLSQG